MRKREGAAGPERARSASTSRQPSRTGEQPGQRPRPDASSGAGPSGRPPLSTDRLLSLQRELGNARVVGMLNPGPHAAATRDPVPATPPPGAHMPVQRQTIQERVNAALDGWGADSARILELTRSASADEKRAVLGDAALVRRLSAELGRADMLQVLENLNAPLVQRLSTAMDGWGADAAAIRRLAAGASPAEKAAVLADAGLVARLAGELGRDDMLDVLLRLDAPLLQRLRAAMSGWGTDEAAIGRMLAAAPTAERDAALADATLVAQLHSELSLADLLRILATAGAPFKRRVELALAPWGAGLGPLRPLIDAATAAERQTVWSDAALMSTAHGVLGEQPYLDFVTLLRMFQPGTTAEDSSTHTSARDADAAIRAHLSAYVGDAVRDGRRIEGFVAVVDDADWDRAGIAHYGRSVWTGGKRDDINGFVDGSDRVWIHRNRGNAGTMIHEAIHKYSDDALKGISQPLNEGVTEYFTRKVCAALTPPITGRGNYQGNYDTVTMLSTLVGESTVASAFFDGATDALEAAFVAAKDQATWDTFVTKTRRNAWADAAALL